MTNVIAFLESLGRDAGSPAQGEALATAAKAAGLDDRTQAALLAGDTGALADRLGGRARMLCALFPADDDQEQEGGDQPLDDEPAEPDDADGVRH